MKIEPTTITIGPAHLVATLNNKALFWSLEELQHNADNCSYFEKDYLATINSICLNETYASVLFDGKLQLHVVRFFFLILPDKNLLNYTINCYSFIILINR